MCSRVINDIINLKMADIISFVIKSRSIYDLLFWRKTVWIMMVKAHCVIITAQVDMNLIVLCERIMELQPSKKMNLMMMIMNES